jgi:hypothetical protein
LTPSEPILFPAEVKNREVIVQRHEVATAAVSPTMLGSKSFTANVLYARTYSLRSSFFVFSVGEKVYQSASVLMLWTRRRTQEERSSVLILDNWRRRSSNRLLHRCRQESPLSGDFLQTAIRGTEAIQRYWARDDGQAVVVSLNDSIASSCAFGSLDSDRLTQVGFHRMAAPQNPCYGGYKGSRIREPPTN